MNGSDILGFIGIDGEIAITDKAEDIERLANAELGYVVYGDSQLVQIAKAVGKTKLQKFIRAWIEKETND